MSSYTETFNNREPPCVTRDAAWSRTHRDLQATAMSIDYSGQWVLLAGRYDDFKMNIIISLTFYWICFVDGIWRSKNSIQTKQMMIIFCENFIAIPNMRLQLPNGQFVMNLKNTVRLPLVNWLKLSHGDPAIQIWFTHYVLILELLPILIGIQRRLIY